MTKDEFLKLKLGDRVYICIKNWRSGHEFTLDYLLCDKDKKIVGTIQESVVNEGKYFSVTCAFRTKKNEEYMATVIPSEVEYYKKDLRIGGD